MFEETVINGGRDWTSEKIGVPAMRNSDVGDASPAFHVVHHLPERALDPDIVAITNHLNIHGHPPLLQITFTAADQ
jgi:hypothetical protein